MLAKIWNIIRPKTIKDLEYEYLSKASCLEDLERRISEIHRGLYFKF